jgi:glyoxylase-like metal-dependent hydrolase (beta-lactamase superfamily II)
MMVGDIEVAVLSDGESIVPGDFFGATDGHHADAVGKDGRIRLPIAAFLLRIGGKTVLLDAGMGPVHIEWTMPSGGELTLHGGGLPAALAAHAVRPEEVDYVMPTHLHADHAGWMFPEGKSYFPNAIIRFGAGDWDPWVENAPDPRFREAMKQARAAGRIQFIEKDGEVLPGLSAMQTPGHSPGHVSYIISSGRQRAIVLGDAISCPLQLQNPEHQLIVDADPQLAIRTREAIFRELDGSADTMVGGPHFPDLRFGRVLMGEGRRYWI